MVVFKLLHDGVVFMHDLTPHRSKSQAALTLEEPTKLPGVAATMPRLQKRAVVGTGMK
jgi:hypothetical protein